MSHLFNIYASVTGSTTKIAASPQSGNSWLRPPGPNRVSIDLRPPIVETNTQLGHWEADTVIGKGHDGVLLTLVERRTKYALVVKLASKHAPGLAVAAIKALRRSGLPVKTITFDNGLEFASHEHIARQLQAVTYFAHPYHSWERGLNENTNGLIRQYIPKSCPISIVRLTDVSWIEDQLNHRPRKSLEGVWELRKVESRANFVATKRQSNDQTVATTDRPSMGRNFALVRPKTQA